MHVEPESVIAPKLGALNPDKGEPAMKIKTRIKAGNIEVNY